MTKSKHPEYDKEGSGFISDIIDDLPFYDVEHQVWDDYEDYMPELEGTEHEYLAKPRKRVELRD